MAEHLLGGTPGDEDEKPESQSREALAGAEAFAAAIAHHAATGDPDVAQRSGAYLDKQSRLLDIQAKHLEAELELRISQLRDQRIGRRLRIGFQVFTVLVATVIGIGGAVMLRDAFASRSVVIEVFEAPPALAPRGISGTVVAGALLDKLGRMQRATHTNSVASEKRHLTSAWSNDVKLAMPEAGISLGEFSKLLKARFGHDLHIGGSLVETETGGLALTVRGDGVPPKTFSGAIGDLATLVTQAAEHVYAESQPVLYSIYLDGEYRYQEEVALVKAVYAGANLADRPFLLNSWANGTGGLGGALQEELALYRAALKLKPNYWVVYSNIMYTLVQLRDEEGAWRMGEELRRAAGGRPGAAADLFYSGQDQLTWDLQELLKSVIADAAANGGQASGSATNATFIAQLQALLHEPEAAELTLATTSLDSRDPSIAAAIHFDRGLIALDAGDVARAVAELEAFDASFGTPLVDNAILKAYRCWLAPAEDAAGHPERADAVFKSAGTYVDCHRFRGDILDGRGDWPGAQKAYADALAPDLPAGYYSWGVALARHGDLAGAQAKLKDANRRGPHWAEPLKAWGEALMKQGHAKEAFAKYNEALKYAPNWAALSSVRATAAQAL